MSGDRAAGARLGAHVNLPIDIDEAERWTALGDDGIAFFVRTLAFSARNLTNGVISQRAFKILTVHLKPRHAAQVVERLVQGGFWELTPNGWRVVDWEQYALTAAEVEARRATNAANAVAGGVARATTAPRDARGRMIAAVQPEAQPGRLDGHQPEVQQESSPNTVALTDADAVGLWETASPAELKSSLITSGVATHHVVPPATGPLGELPIDGDDDDGISSAGAAGHPPPPVSTSVSHHDDHERVRGIRVGRRGKRYDPSWSPASEPYHAAWRLPEKAAFRAAWMARGFQRPPTERQWALLDGLNRAVPDVLAGLVAEAPPGVQSNEVVRHILRRINADPALRVHMAGARHDAPDRPGTGHDPGPRHGAPAREPAPVREAAPWVAANWNDELGGEFPGDEPDDGLDGAFTEVGDRSNSGAFQSGTVATTRVACRDFRAHQLAHRWSEETQQFVCDKCTPAGRPS